MTSHEITREPWAHRMAREVVLDAIRERGVGADTDDCTQDIWLQILSRPSVDVRSPRAWLRKVAHDRAVDFSRASAVYDSHHALHGYTDIDTRGREVR